MLIINTHITGNDIIYTTVNRNTHIIHSIRNNRKTNTNSIGRCCCEKFSSPMIFR